MGVDTPTGSDARSATLTFLIADVRGYTAFTQAHGDQAAARLATTFAEIAREGVEAHGGEVIELRGDEALAVFTMAPAALRAAVDLQMVFADGRTPPRRATTRRDRRGCGRRRPGRARVPGSRAESRRPPLRQGQRG